jgi:1,2-phenylacetyl-CoA epoxidase PaaB subunit
MNRYMVNCWVVNRQTELADIRSTFTVNAEDEEQALIRAQQLEKRGYDFDIALMAA